MTTAFEIAAATDDLCGEAPLWIEDNGSLLWVDQGRSLVRKLKADKTELVAKGFAAGGIARMQDGAVLLAGPDGLARLNPAGDLERLQLEPLTSGGCLNDICAGPGGELYAGVMSLSADATCVRGPGALVRIARDGKVNQLDGDVLLPNGMKFSPDQQWLYLVDSARRQVLAYPARELGQARARPRVFATLSPEDGFPDGLAIDADGGVWLALWYRGEVVRLSSSGQVDLRLQLPFKQVSSLAFGGVDGCDLYVTTAAAPWHSVFAPPNWSSDKAPQGGPLLRLRTQVPGARLNRVTCLG